MKVKAKTKTFPNGVWFVVGKKWWQSGWHQKALEPASSGRPDANSPDQLRKSLIQHFIHFIIIFINVQQKEMSTGT